MEFKKKDIKKIKKATQEELSKLHEEYKSVAKNVSEMSLAGLLLISLVQEMNIKIPIQKNHRFYFGDSLKYIGTFLL